MGKRVFKYGTGEQIPDGAVYLNTVAQTWLRATDGEGRCWLVWHYFLVEVDDEI